MSPLSMLSFATTTGSKQPTPLWIALFVLSITLLFTTTIYLLTKRRMKKMKQKLDEQNKQLTLSEQRLDLALEGANLGLWDWNIITEELYIDERWAAILGYEKEDIVPHVSSWTKLLHPDDIEGVEHKLNEHLAGQHKSYFTEQRLKMKNGDWKWILDTGQVVERDSNGKATRAIGVIFDIDRTKKHQFYLEKLASSDALTEIYNRRYFFSRLNEHFAMLKRGKKQPVDINCSLAIIDIDHFKKINDTWGHLAGDFVLKKFAKTVSETMRMYDVLARYGGEEFVILFLDCGKEVASNILERIRTKNKKISYEYKGEKIPVNFSAGLSAFNDFTFFPESIDDLIKLTDDRLYKAKESGRDRIVNS